MQGGGCRFDPDRLHIDTAASLIACGRFFMRGHIDCPIHSACLTEMLLGHRKVIAPKARKFGFPGIILKIRKFNAVYHDTYFRC